MHSRVRVLVCVMVSASVGVAPSVKAQNAASAPASQQGTAAPPAAKLPRSVSAPPAASLQTQPKAVAQKPDKNLIPEAWDLLETAVMSDKLQSRSDGVSALAGMQHNLTAIHRIIQAVDDKDESVRVLAVTSLGDMKAREAIPRLRDALDDDSGPVSFAAAQALWKMDDHTGSDILYEVLAGERKVSPSVIKSKMDKAKKEMHDPKALALIAVNQTSGAFLGPFSMGVSFAEEYATDHSAPIQAVCARLLAQDRGERAARELQDALGDKNWVVRAAAARSLAQLGRRQAIPQLADMMHTDKSQPARFTAAAAIIQLSPAENAAYLAKKRAEARAKPKPAPTAPAPSAPTPENTSAPAPTAPVAIAK
jgi:HEAT repeat protein